MLCVAVFVSISYYGDKSRILRHDEVLAARLNREIER